MSSVSKLVVTVALLFASQTSIAVTYSGVDFPDGSISFADAVVDYSLGSDVAAPWNDPENALGIPDYDGTGNTAVSLGEGGWAIFQFTDNSLTTSGDDTADLHIFEVGGVTEWFNVQISIDASSWIDLGNVLGQPTSIDIDPIAGVTLWEKYSYVMLTDISPNQSGSPYGEADIDAIGAISSAPPVVSTVPVPAAVWLFGTAIAGFAGFSRYKKKAA